MRLSRLGGTRQLLFGAWTHPVVFDDDVVCLTVVEGVVFELVRVRVYYC